MSGSARLSLEQPPKGVDVIDPFLPGCRSRVGGPFVPLPRLFGNLKEYACINRHEQGEELINTVLEKLASLDDPTQNRYRLALRWYQRYFGDDRLVEIPWKGRLTTLSIAGWPWNAGGRARGSYVGGFESG
jgi:hypothetical protein